MLAALLALAALAQERTFDPIRKPALPESRASVPAREFELPEVAGGTFRLSEACGEGWVLLVFVRGMW